MTGEEPAGGGARAHAAAISVLVIVIIALFWRVFFLGETLVDLAAHQNQLPWGAETSEFDGYAFNRRDLTDTYITRDYFVVDSYRRGELPLWNPYILSGHPIYADGVTKLFSPFNLLYIWFDVPLGYTIGRLMELALAAVFLYVFLVHLGLSPPASLVGSLVFTLSDHVMLRLTGEGWVGGLMWLPLMLLGADIALRRRRLLPAAGAGAALALQFYCGFMPAAIYYVGAIGAYYLWVSWLTRDGESGSRAVARGAGYLAFTVVTGFALSAIIWLPVFELLGYSNRKIVPTELGYIWMPPWHLITLILPRVFGKAFDPNFLEMFVGVGVSQDRSVYLGIVTLFLTGLAVWRPVDRRVYYFAGLVAFSLFVVTCAPIYVHLTRFLPVVRTIRAITRVNGLYAVGGAVTAAYGAQRLLSLDRSATLAFLSWARRLALWILSGIALLTVAFWSFSTRIPTNFRDGSRWRRLAVRLALTLSNQFQPSIANIDLWIPVGVLLIVLALCWFFSRGDWSPRILLAVLTVVLCCELVWNDSQYNPTFRRDALYSATATTDFLRDNIGNDRVVVVPAGFGGETGTGRDRKLIAPPNTLMPYQIATISGKDQLFPRWYRGLTSLIEPQPELSHIIFNNPRSPVYDLLGVKFLLTSVDNRLDSPSYREVLNREGVRVYQNLSVMPRAFLAASWTEVKSPAEALAIMRDEGFNPREIVAVESAPGELAGVETPGPGDAVEITAYAPDTVTLRASAGGARLVVLTDVYYPGWDAFVDGSSARLLRVDYALRGVVIGPGQHIIQFVFRPKSLRYGMIISLTTSLVVLAAASFVWIKTKSAGRKRNA
jgi:Bacterial membrane protein YfhO